MDGLLQPRIGSLFQGVSRQAPLLRAPNQFEDLVNFLPSVDIGGSEDRAGTGFIESLPRNAYSAGPHHYFRTTDGQRWVLLRLAGTAAFEVRNWNTGTAAALDVKLLAGNYLNAGIGSASLRFLTVADTTLILNPAVTVLASESAKPALTTCYVVVRRVSTAAQQFIIARSNGASAVVRIGNDNRDTRETIANSLCVAVGATPALQMTATQLGNAPYVVRLDGAADVLATVSARCTWDEAAVTLIKGRVTASSDLPPAFVPGNPIGVDLSHGDKSAMYYVRYDLDVNAWIETSYLPNDATTATLNGATMPARMKQTGASSFEIDVCPWSARTRGDQDSNPLPFFVGKRITSFATWKGRLIVASQDTAVMSQADDLFNFWKETARESRAADPIELPADTPGLSEIRHVVPFRNKLTVTADNAQLEVSGDQPLTPDSATMGVATRYALDKDCTPVVIGDSLYYTGISSNRAALWEYYYDQDAASNTAFDLSKHVPGFIAGKVIKIDGTAEAGRVVIKAGAPNTLYVHTSYWADGRRAQNAWTRLVFPGLQAIWDHWIDDNHLRLIGVSASRLWRLTMPLDTAPESEVRLDFQSERTALKVDPVTSRVTLPTGLAELGQPVFAVRHAGDAWYTEHTGTVVTLAGVQYLDLPAALEGLAGILGIRYERSFTFSPFYPSIGESPTPIGRLQVRKVILDLLKAGDLKAVVTRTDRQPNLVVMRSPRVLGANAVAPIVGRDFQMPIPFNSRGDKATLTVSTTSTVPMTVTGYTLMARYTNPFTET